MKKITFLGLGAMGSRMAAHLVKPGYSLTVWNRDQVKANQLVRQGAVLADSPRAAVKDADYIISMLTDDSAAREVWLGAQSGAVGGLRPGAIVIESSTITPSWARQLASAVQDRSCFFLDAPVAGSRPQAEAAQLIFMVGGATNVFETASPILNSMGASVVHVGDVGQGAVLKLAVNTIFAAQLQSVAELLGYLTRNGFDTHHAASLLALFPVVAPPIAGVAKMMAEGKDTPLFTVDLIEKDLGYILETAITSGAILPGAENVRKSFQKAQQMGLGRENITSIYEIFSLKAKLV